MIHIGALPNELQDIVFAHLGWELTMFSYDPSTSSSAFKALWSYNASEGGRPEPSNDRAFVAYARHHLVKPVRMCAAIKADPVRAEILRELTLFIPKNRVVANAQRLEIASE